MIPRMCQQPGVGRGIYNHQPARGLRRFAFSAADDQGRLFCSSSGCNSPGARPG